MSKLSNSSEEKVVYDQENNKLEQTTTEVTNSTSIATISDTKDSGIKASVNISASCNEAIPSNENTAVPTAIISSTFSPPSTSSSSAEPSATIITTSSENISSTSTTSLPTTITSAADTDMNTRSSHPNLPLTNVRFDRRDSNQSSTTTTNSSTNNWRYNFNNLFQEIRPFVQHAQNVNNRQSILTSWIPQGRHFRVSTNGNNNNHNNSNNIVIQSSNSISSGSGIVNSANISNADSFVINVDSPNNNTDTILPTTSTSGNINNDTNSIGNGISVNNEIGDRQMHTHQYHVHHMGGTTNNSTNTGDDTNNSSSSSRGNQPHHHHNHNHNRANNPNENEEESVSEVIAQIPEARALINAIRRYTPYICILLAKSCYDHLDGILHFFTLFVTFSHANWVVRQEIGKQVSSVSVKLSLIHN